MRNQLSNNNKNWMQNTNKEKHRCNIRIIEWCLAKIIAISKEETGKIDTVKIVLIATKEEYSLERADFQFVALDTRANRKNTFIFNLNLIAIF